MLQYSIQMCLNLNKNLKSYFSSLLGQLLTLISIQILITLMIFPIIIIYFYCNKSSVQEDHSIIPLISIINIVNTTLQNVFTNAISIITTTQNQILQLTNNNLFYNAKQLCIHNCVNMNSNISANSTVNYLSNHAWLMNSQQSLIKNMQIILFDSQLMISIPASKNIINYKITREGDWNYNILVDGIIIIKRCSFGLIIINITAKEISQKFDSNFKLTQMSSKMVYVNRSCESCIKYTKLMNISITSHLNLTFQIELPITVQKSSSLFLYTILILFLVNIFIIFPIRSFIKNWIQSQINPLLKVQNILQIKLEAAFKQENLPKANILCKTKVMQDITNEYMDFSENIKRFPLNQKEQIKKSQFKFQNRLKWLVNQFEKYIKPTIDQRMIEIINNKKILIAVNNYFQQEEKQLRQLKRQCQKNFQEFFKLAFLSMIQDPPIFYETLLQLKASKMLSQIFYNINIVLKSKDVKIFCEIELFNYFLRDSKQQMYYPIIRRIQNLLFPKYLALFKQFDIGSKWIVAIKFNQHVSLLQKEVENIRYESSKLDRHLKLYK